MRHRTAAFAVYQKLNIIYTAAIQLNRHLNSGMAHAVLSGADHACLTVSPMTKMSSPVEFTIEELWTVTEIAGDHLINLVNSLDRNQEGELDTHPFFLEATAFRLGAEVGHIREYREKMFSILHKILESYDLSRRVGPTGDHYDCAVAWFTFTLWRSSEKLWAESRAQGRATRKALKLSRKEFEAAYRPWIAIRKIRVVEPVAFKGGALPIKVEITIENVGSAPATDLLPMHDSHPQNRMPPIKDIMGKIAVAYGAHKNNPYIEDALPAHVVMPGEVSVLSVEFILDAEEFLRAPANPNLAFFSPIMVGGFFYRSPLHKRDRCTGFTYAASLKDNWVELSIDGSSEPVPARNVTIRKWQAGWTAT